jgi:hypothetical protein
MMIFGAGIPSSDTEVSYIGTTTYNIDHSSGTLSLPSGLQENDVVIVCGTRDRGTSHSVPSGWTNLVDSSDNTPDLWIDYKMMGATPDSNYVFNDHLIDYACGVVIAAFRGVNTTTPFIISDSASGTVGLPNCPSMTPTFGQVDGMFFLSGHLDDDAVTDGGAPSGYSNFAYANAVSEFYVSTGFTATKKILDTSAEDPAAFSGTGTDYWWAYTIIVQPQ